MKIVVINAVDKIIIRDITEISKKHFDNISSTISIFQSSLYPYISLDNSHRAPAAVMEKKDIPVLSKKFEELEELTPFILKKRAHLIVWFGKSIQDRSDVELKMIIAHELKHVEQLFFHKNAYFKGQLLDCICKWKLPMDIDADNFACIVICDIHNRHYSWIDDIEKLFLSESNKIQEIYKQIKDKKNMIIVSNVDLDFNDQIRELFSHFYQKIK